MVACFDFIFVFKNFPPCRSFLTKFLTAAMLLSSDSEDEAPPSQSKLRINESYAKRLEHNKAREELHRLQAKYGDVKLSSTKENGEDELEEESSTSEEEDEFGELVTPRVDAEIWRTLAMIREGRPEIYDENWKVFTDDDAEDNAAEKKGKEKVATYSDFVDGSQCT